MQWYAYQICKLLYMILLQKANPQLAKAITKDKKFIWEHFCHVDKTTITKKIPEALQNSP